MVGRSFTACSEIAKYKLVPAGRLNHNEKEKKEFAQSIQSSLQDEINHILCAGRKRPAYHQRLLRSQIIPSYIDPTPYMFILTKTYREIHMAKKNIRLKDTNLKAQPIGEQKLSLDESLALFDPSKHGGEVMIFEDEKIICAIPKKRVRGLLKGQIHLGPEFDEPLPKDLLDGFEGITPS